MSRVVLDTNVLVSGMINPFGAPGRILDLVREGVVNMAVDDRILSEYAAVLHRPKFEAYFTHQEVRDVLMFLEHNTVYLVCTRQVRDLPDQSDAPFIETAIAAGVPLVTGNMAHFPPRVCGDVSVLSSSDFLAGFRS